MAVAVLNLFQASALTRTLTHASATTIILLLTHLQVPTAVVTRATETALSRNRKSLASAGGGAALPVNKDDNSSGSGSPSPEKTALPAPIGKPKRVRPVSSTDSPAGSLVVGGAAAAVVKPVGGAR